MFKDCKCGRSIPKQWPRCGECTQKRSIVDMHQRMEGKSYRDKVSTRSAVVQSIVKGRAGVVPNEVNPDLTAIKAAQEDIAKAILVMRLIKQIDMKSQFEHDNLAPALKVWMEDDD